MRLLIITPEFLGSGGGIMTFYQSLTASLAQEGAKVHVIQSGPFISGIEQCADVAGVCVETLQPDRIYRWEAKFTALGRTPVFRRALASAWAAWEQVEYGRDFDVVEATDFGLCFVPVLLSQSIPSVMQMHGSIGQISLHDPVRGQEMDGLVSLAVETECARLAAALQTPSLANAAYWEKQARRVTQCIRPAFTPRPRSDQSLPSSRLVVVGRVQRWKGPQILCEAMRLLGSSAPEVDWYGRDMPFGELGMTTGQWLRAKYPDVWGVKIINKAVVPSEALGAVQSAALLNIVPSTWDVFNFTAVEAMASGRPLICSSAAGASELIIHGSNGYTYVAEQAAELAASIETALLLSPKAQSEMAEAARETVEKSLSPLKIAQQRMAAYNIAMDSGLPQAPVSDWLENLCRPSEGRSAPLRFLDGLPIRGIAEHLAQRMLRKILQR